MFHHSPWQPLPPTPALLRSRVDPQTEQENHCTMRRENTTRGELLCHWISSISSFFYSTFILLTNVSGHSWDPHAKYITSMMAINIFYFWHYKQHYIPPLTFAVRRRRTGGERGYHWWEWWTSPRVSSGPPLHGLDWSTSSWKCGLCQRCIAWQRGGRWDKGQEKTVRH